MYQTRIFNRNLQGYWIRNRTTKYIWGTTGNNAGLYIGLVYSIIIRFWDINLSRQKSTEPQQKDTTVNNVLRAVYN